MSMEICKVSECGDLPTQMDSPRTDWKIFERNNIYAYCTCVNHLRYMYIFIIEEVNDISQIFSPFLCGPSEEFSTPWNGPSAYQSCVLFAQRIGLPSRCARNNIPIWARNESKKKVSVCARMEWLFNANAKWIFTKLKWYVAPASCAWCASTNSKCVRAAAVCKCM